MEKIKIVRKCLKGTGNTKNNIKIISIFILSMLLSVCIFVKPRISGSIIDKGFSTLNIDIILCLSLVMLVIQIFETICNVIQSKMLALLQCDIQLSLYRKILDKLFNKKMDYFIKLSSAELVNQISVDINTISLVADKSILLFAEYIIRVVCGLIGMMIINYRLCIIAICIIPLKYLTIYFFSKHKQKQMKLQIQYSKEFSCWLGDNIDGIKEIKLWGIYKKRKEQLTKLMNCLLKNYKQGVMLDTYKMNVDILFDAIGLFVIYFIGGHIVCNMDMSLGNLLTFMSYNSYVSSSVSSVLNIKYLIFKIYPSAIRFNEFVTQEQEQDGIKNINKSNDFQIELKDICFSYYNKRVISNLNLKINSGEKIAIMGENGAGKTTLINLILGLLYPDDGEILLNGKNILSYKKDEYRKLFGFVDQKVFLFKDTIENNLLIEDGFTNILQNPLFKSIIKSHKEGGSYVLGKNADNLSGGERQKIAILRALEKKDTSIIISDEIFTYLDRNTQIWLENKLLNRTMNKTVIIITHNLQEIKMVDKVYEIKEGKLVRRYDL